MTKKKDMMNQIINVVKASKSNTTSENAGIAAANAITGLIKADLKSQRKAN